MTRQYTNSRNGQAIVRGAFVGLVLAVSVYELEGAMAEWCSVVGRAAWVVPELIRLLTLASGWHAATPYFSEGSGIFQVLLEIGHASGRCFRWSLASPSGRLICAPAWLASLRKYFQREHRTCRLGCSRSTLL